MSENFIKLSDQQKERKKQHIYPHRLACKGYAHFAEEIATELCDDDDINRDILWKKGRINREGNFEGEDLTNRVQKTDDYIQQKWEDKLKFERTEEDLLTKALETQESNGHVRGIGGHVIPSIYFNVGRTWKSAGVSKHVITEHKKKLMEAKRKISEQNAHIQKLEALVYKRGACDISIDDKGICSVKGKTVALTLESSTNIAAYGTIFCVNGPDKLFHGVPLPMNCMRVSIDEAVDKSAPFPFPIPNECEAIGDTVGSHVASPRHLIVKQAEPSRTNSERTKKKYTMSASVPRSLHMLYCYSKRALNEGRYISLFLDHGVFDADYELLLHLEDIIPLYHLDPISSNYVVG